MDVALWCYKCTSGWDGWIRWYEVMGYTFLCGRGEVMGKMDATRQCVTFDPRLRALNSRSTADFATKVTIAAATSGTGTRNTV